MKHTVKLCSGEMMEICDNAGVGSFNAYDKLQSALEIKLCEIFSEKAWLKAWGEGDFEIEMTLTVNINLEA
jgi:hypothetical protein